MTLSDSELISSNIKTASQPSKLKITEYASRKDNYRWADSQDRY